MNTGRVFKFGLVILTLTPFLHDIQALANDIKASLFPQGSPEAGRLKLDIVRQQHIVLRGGRWKHHVTSWLKDKGF